MTTTRAALPYVPRDDLAEATPRQRAILERASRAHPPQYRMLVYSVLLTNNWDEEVVEDSMETLLSYLSRSLSNRVVTPLYKSTNGVFDACTVMLEDGRGGVARDVRGNPICCTFGIADTAFPLEQAVDIAVWGAKRVARYLGPDEIPRTTNVIDLLYRAKHDVGKKPRMPEAQMIELSTLLPNTNAMTYVCGAPPDMQATVFKTVATFPILRRWASNFVFCDGYSCLRGVIPPEHMLPWWAEDATFDFDLDAYRRVLEEEECVSDGVNSGP
tara:strand:- start:9446 stop:10261 length:816 start_codon:yes stop_codon:yes gene_type:complete